MSKQHDFNPHFRDEGDTLQLNPPKSKPKRTRRLEQERRQNYPPPPIPIQSPPTPHIQPPRPYVQPPAHIQPPLPAYTQPPPPAHIQPPPHHIQLPPPQPPPQYNPHEDPRQRHGPHPRHSSLMAPQMRRTKPGAWFVALFCTILWVLIIIGGLAILIVYLVFRPQSPRFDIQNVGLNAAYLDTGILLNADITLLVNFSNPNKKVGVDFSYVDIQLYYGNTLIATSSIDPFSETRTESKLFNIHMISSEVRIPVIDVQRLKKQMEGNSIPFYVKGLFRTRSKFGDLIRYTYWLHGRCTIVLTAPPSGVLRSHKCRTKR
ncbi:hypothetical protein ACHQM5_010978 [Ranunculus cassubicifolius]